MHFLCSNFFSLSCSFSSAVGHELCWYNILPCRLERISCSVVAIHLHSTASLFRILEERTLPGRSELIRIQSFTLSTIFLSNNNLIRRDPSQRSHETFERIHLRRIMIFIDLTSLTSRRKSSTLVFPVTQARQISQIEVSTAHSIFRCWFSLSRPHFEYQCLFIFLQLSLSTDFRAVRLSISIRSCHRYAWRSSI